jgi:small subunit ribosomal protein S3
MGQKVNPNGFRTGIIRDWQAIWSVPKKDISSVILEDHKIRKFINDNYGIKAQLNNCSISRISIERLASRVIVNIWTGRPGVLIGQKGSNLEGVKNNIKKIIGTKTLELNIKEVKNQDIDVNLIAQNIAVQLEKRIAWRRAMKMAIQKAMKQGVVGIKVMLSGRLDGADIARSEHYHEGVLPLHTIRSDIEYGFAEAKTTFGIIGVKCWICNGEVKGKRIRTGAVIRSEKPKQFFKKFDGEDKRLPFRRFDNDRKPRDYQANFSKKYDGGERKNIDPARNQGGFNKSFVPKTIIKKEGE